MNFPDGFFEQMSKKHDITPVVSSHSESIMPHLVRINNGGSNLSEKELFSLMQKLDGIVKGKKPADFSEDDLMAFFSIRGLLTYHDKELPVNLTDAINIDKSILEKYPDIIGIFDRVQATRNEIRSFQYRSWACGYFVPTPIGKPFADAVLRLYIKLLPKQMQDTAKDMPENLDYKIDIMDYNGWSYAIFGYPDREAYNDQRSKLVKEAENFITTAPEFTVKSVS